MTDWQKAHEESEAAKYGHKLQFDFNAMTAMRKVFENGEVLVDDTFDEIRARAKNEEV